MLEPVSKPAFTKFTTRVFGASVISPIFLNGFEALSTADRDRRPSAPATWTALHAMLENLIQTLPESRCALLRQELTLLHRSAERFLHGAQGSSPADVADFQGVGGSQVHAKGGLGQATSSTAHSLASATR